MVYFLAPLIGFVAGFVGCLVGIGGGVIMVPMLNHIMGLEQPRAHATSLTAVFFTGLIGALAYGRYGYLNFHIIFPLMVSAILGGYLGARSLKNIEKGKLRRYFGIFLIVVAFLMFFKVLSRNLGFKVSIFYGLPIVPVCLILGFVIGFLSGLLGVGGGTLMVPLLVLFLNLPQHISQGASLAVMVPTALVGSLVHLVERRVELRIAPYLWFSIVIGGFLGSYTAHLFPGRELRLIFGVVILLLGIIYLLRNK